MANFCQNCGSPLVKGAKFCAECGAPIAPSAPVAPSPAQTRQEPQNEPQQMQWQYTAQPQAGRKKDAAYAQQGNRPPKKKKGKGGKLFFALLLVAVIGAVWYFCFRDGGQTRSSETYDVQQMQSLLAYAEQLEKAGNSEAAASVYALIAKGGGAELIQNAHKGETVIEKADEVGQIETIFGHSKGGGGT